MGLYYLNLTEILNHFFCYKSIFNNWNKCVKIEIVKTYVPISGAPHITSQLNTPTLLSFHDLCV